MGDWRKAYLSIPVLSGERSAKKVRAESRSVRDAIVWPADRIISKTVRGGCSAADYKKYAGGE